MLLIFRDLPIFRAAITNISYEILVVIKVTIISWTNISCSTMIWVKLKYFSTHRFIFIKKSNQVTKKQVSNKTFITVERFAQHRRASTNSAVFDHQQATGHTFNLEDVQILDREPWWFERGVKEAIFERRDAPDLNKKGGLRHELSFSWNKCLKWQLDAF